MKGDFSRRTFAPEKHYSGVLMQQGRVQVDADFNEQQAISRHRDEAEARDVIGLCGTPLDAPSRTHARGFEIAPEVAQQPTTFTIGAGRYYVDGILCDNEGKIDYEDQAHAPLEYPAASTVIGVLGNARLGLVYLDVWRRHVTLLEDPSIHETALGEADTTTRMKTTWQVKVLPLETQLDQTQSQALDEFVDEMRGTENDQQRARLRHDIETVLGLTCGSRFAAWSDLVSPSPGPGRMRATTGTPQTQVDPCLPPPGAGYTRLENQFYRVEIHDGGTIPGASKPTLKWSRDNGSVVTRILDFDTTDPRWITVHDLGRDTSALSFSIGDWVEVVNDHSELSTNGAQLGHLAAIVDMQPARNAIQLSAAAPSAAPASLRDPALNPRLRRWDQVTVAPIPADPGPPATPAVPGVTPNEHGIGFDNTTPLPIEDGIAVDFTEGAYRPGDYWQFPARTSIGDIEWPTDSAGNRQQLPPGGVRHHYCRLALIAQNSTRDGIAVVSDCRDAFPPLTALTSFFYLGGDGQEVIPVEAAGDATPVDLPEPLEVGVARGSLPVAGATVRFEVVSGGGQLDGGAGPIEVLTDATGVASCTWSVSSNFPDPQDARHQLHQQVKATLLDQPGGQAIHLPIVFSANLSVAADVRYYPPCQNASGNHDVQAAVDWLVELVRLEYVSGDGQIVMPRERTKLQPLRVLVASDCGPVAGATVEFTGDGKFGPVTATTNANGVASTRWVLDPWDPAARNFAQRANAKLTQLGPNAGVVASVDPSASAYSFVAHLNVADEVAYDPTCSQLQGLQVTTVKEALDGLCDLAVKPVQPAIHVVGVTRAGDGKPLINDDDVTLKELLRPFPTPPPARLHPVPGIVIELDKPIDPATLRGKSTGSLAAGAFPDSHPACFLTLFLPWPLTPSDEGFWTTHDTAGFQPLVLADFIELSQGNRLVVWSPSLPTRAWLMGALFQTLGQRAVRVLARLTLKGDFIYTKPDNPLYLDGEPLGPRPTVNFAKRSGDGVAGGDFEIWFWLLA